MTTRILLLFLGSSSALVAVPVERQITTAAQSHILTNTHVWSPDGSWIVYDTRSGDAFNGSTIEQVNLRSGIVRQLYRSTKGAHCGVATYSPASAKVVFILGPENPDSEWTYGFSRRHGMIVNVANPGKAEALDAMNYAPPFTPGALRGGSHVHVFSGDATFISFTYDDEVLSRLDNKGSNAIRHEPNQRNIGLTRLGSPVRVLQTHPRNHDGSGFSVLVTRTVAHPQPGSDEIARAYEEGWIGTCGYSRPDGTHQARAIAFQGLVTAPNGTQHSEVFVVDIPNDIEIADRAPLQGTPTTRPAPPKGTVQRRLTFTTARRFPGIAQSPRHWLRSDPSGNLIAFLMKDETGIIQLWTVSPNGSDARQVTNNPSSVTSAFSWSPDGQHIAHIMDGSVCMTHVRTGKTMRLTERRSGDDAPSPLACVFSPDGSSIAFMRTTRDSRGTFPQIFVVDANTRTDTTGM